MKLLVPPVWSRLLPDAPFEGAAPGRQQLAENATRLLSASEEGLVVTVEASWGEGKTSFLRMWKTYLEQDDHFIPVYYDAFAFDFTDDPFVSISAAIYEALRDRTEQRRRQRRDRQALEQLRHASKILAAGLAQMTAGLAVSTFSSGAVSGTSFLDWCKRTWARLQHRWLELNADAKLQAFLDSDQTIKSYRGALEDLLRPSPEEYRKIVVFVDELDRCRPIFAVEVIEKIKHLFNIPGVYFILGINRQQLLATVRHTYGVSEEDAEIYLEKFVDFGTSLPTFHRGSTRDQKIELLARATRSVGLASGERDISSQLPDLADLTGPHYFDLSFREVERVISYTSLALHSCSDSDARRLSPFVPVAAVVRVGSPESFQRLREEGAIASSRSGTVQNRFFQWAKKHFEETRDDKAANIFVVKPVCESARLLALYEIPEPHQPSSTPPDSSLDRDNGPTTVD